VLLPDEPYVFAEKHIADLAELDLIPAGRERRIHLVDGKAMFWYGRRTIGAVAELRRLIAGT
jgi:ABC-type hemin transport system substrate-binding protein